MKILTDQEASTVKALIMQLTFHAHELDELNIKSENFYRAFYHLDKLQEEFNQDKENYEYKV